MFKKLGDLLSEVHENYNKFIGVKNSEDAKRKLDSAEADMLLLNGFGDFESPINLLTFDWMPNEQDRNWWWQLQALPFLNWHIGAYDLLSASEKIRANSFCCQALVQWMLCASNNLKSPLVWHDHASAFRLRNLVRWVVFMAENDTLSSMNDEDQVALFELVQRHVDYLLKEENYSKHTNHGFDQMLVLYTVGLLFPNTDWLFRPKEIAYERLVAELDFAFTPQGVHKENSPGYQKFMLSRLQMLKDLREFGDFAISRTVDELIIRAETFLAAITLPDGYLPIIGDTKGFDSGIINTYGQFEVLDYSLSGYLIVRGRDIYGIDFHFIYKCAHFSDYHRHDDDLSIHLYYNNEVIFGDGGLLFYNENDEKRKYVRSPFAHTSLFIDNRTAQRQRSKLSALPGLKLEGAGRVVGESFSYGVRLKRTVDFSLINFGKLSITDECDDEAQPFDVNFFYPGECNVSARRRGSHMEVNASYVNIISNTNLEPSVFKGWRGQAHNSAIFSSRYGEYKEATRIVFRKAIKTTKFEINFSPKKIAIADDKACEASYVFSDDASSEIMVEESILNSTKGLWKKEGSNSRDVFVEGFSRASIVGLEDSELDDKFGEVAKWFVNVDNNIDYFLAVSKIKNIRLDISGTLYRPHYSLVSEAGLVYTWFVSGGLGFWLVQHHSNLLIYAPLESRCIALTKKSDSECAEVLADLAKRLFSQLCKNGSQGFVVGGAYGVFVSYSRPYHYFVDTLSTAFSLAASECSTSFYKNIISLKSASFFPSADFFSADSSHEFDNADALNDHLFSCGQYLAKPVKNAMRNSLHSGEFHKSVLAYSARVSIHNSYLLKIASLVDQFDLVIWLGGCAEKRSWFERADGFLELIQEFKKHSEKLLVLFDGITSPVNESIESYSDAFAQGDLDFFAALVNKSPGALMFNMVGMKSHEKIFLARRCNFFISNFLSDSLHVARFANIPGLAYGSTASHPRQHRHPYTTFLPSNFVRDEVDGRRNWPSVNYHINPKVVADAAISVWQRRKNIKSDGLFFGRGFRCVFGSVEDSLQVVSLLEKHTYICVGEPYKGFDVHTKGAIPIICGERYLFRFEAFSTRGTTLYVIGYGGGERLFTERTAANTSKYVDFPAGVTHFRCFLRLAGRDALDFFDIHWSSPSVAGSARLGECLNFQR